MFSKFKKIFDTVKFLKPKQINYRLYYLLRSRYRNFIGYRPLFNRESKSYPLKLQESIHIIDSYLGDNHFIFLNLSKKFENNIDWNYSGYGKLWTYNLTYFDFLSQNNSREFIFLIEDFIDHIDGIKDGLEPFPISLRGINWIKYFSFHNVENQKIDNSLYAQYYILLDNLEYHLLGNHLLENGFSLLFGAYYFQDMRLYIKAKEILLEQLNEQILKDGGHFELSPMYHQIMLFRLLDIINLVKNNNWQKGELLEFFIKRAELMLGWIKEISYKNGDIPLLNDSANKIAPRTEELIDYANRLGIKSKNIKLSNSGYRKIIKPKYEAIVDVGEVGAKYIAGHAHADTFSFELRIKENPFIIDAGISTYEIGKIRDMQRSTAYHNTVEINGKNQSDVWGGFRVGNRANILDIKENNNKIEATHNGYKPILHTREWTFEEDKIIIKDYISDKVSQAIARLHFHPNVSKEDIKKHIVIEDNKDFYIDNYFYANEFNKLEKSNCLNITFYSTLKLTIIIYN